MQEAFIIVGLPSSGKTTFAKYLLSLHQNTLRLSLKDTALMLDCEYKPERLGIYQRQFHYFLHGIVTRYFDPIIDDMNLTVDERSEYIAYLRKIEPKIRITIFQMAVPPAQCLAINPNLNPDIMEELAKAYQYPTIKEGADIIRGVRWKQEDKGPRPEIFPIAPANLNVVQKRGPTPV